jgi:dolichol-phosphate mannosyltransferase
MSTGKTGKARTAATPPEVSVVVPVFNEAENIASLLAEIHDVLKGVIDYEVIVVDDGSTDATPQVLLDCVTKYGRLRPLRHERNCGQSAALVSGVWAARSEWIATLDGDGQNDPADIRALLAKLRAAPADQRPAIICGQRVRRKDSWLKRVSAKIANAIRGRILHDRTPDSGCGLKVFRRDVFLKLPRFDHMHRFLPALFQMAEEQVVSVPVNHRPRTKGRSHYGLHDRLWAGIVDILGVMWLGRRMQLTNCCELCDRAREESSEDPTAPVDLPCMQPGGKEDA